MNFRFILLLFLQTNFHFSYSQQPKIYFETSNRYNNSEITLYKSIDTGGSIIITKKKIVDGRALITLPKQAEPFSGTYKISSKEGSQVIAGFIVTNDIIKIKIDTNSTFSKITGGENDFAQKNLFLLFALPEIIASHPMRPNLAQIDNFNSKDIRLNYYWKEYESNIYDFISQKKNYYFVLESFYSKKENRPLSFVKKGFSLFSDSLKNTTLGKKFKQYILNREKLSIGSNAPNFKLVDVYGRKIDFTDLYTNDKIILLDFWASWCAPCRKEIKYLQSIYNQIDTSKVQIISISIDDVKEKWLQASKSESFIWDNFLLEGVSKIDVMSNFLINSIPRRILISSKGKIIDLGLEPEEIDKVLNKHDLMKK